MTFTTLVVAARLGDTGSSSDFFKLSINGTLATLEPATSGLVGLALAGLVFHGRRCKVRGNS